MQQPSKNSHYFIITTFLFLNNQTVEINAFKDSDLDQSIFETNDAKDLIACFGFLTLKNVPTVALFALLICFKSGTIFSFKESMNSTTLCINFFSSGISLSASMITSSKAPFLSAGTTKDMSLYTSADQRSLLFSSLFLLCSEYDIHKEQIDLIPF